MTERAVPLLEAKDFQLQRNRNDTKSNPSCFEDSPDWLRQGAQSLIWKRVIDISIINLAMYVYREDVFVTIKEKKSNHALYSKMKVLKTG